jgi:putative chitinase
MITRDQIKKIAPNSKDEIVGPLVGYLNMHMPKYGVNNYLRVCHFLAQAAHEAASFRTLEEYASGSAYEGRRDLGNTQRGDGVRYKGRGIFQLTGRANYKRIGDLIGLDLENNPELAESPEVSVLTALEYWKTRGLSGWADKDNVAMITKLINGGYNGFEDRKKYLAKAKEVIPKDFTFEKPNVPAPAPVEEPAAEIVIPVIPEATNIVVAKKGDNSPYVADLQNMLIKKGANIKADGVYGKMTERYVKAFQKKNNLAITGTIDTNTLNLLMV